MLVSFSFLLPVTSGEQIERQQKVTPSWDISLSTNKFFKSILPVHASLWNKAFEDFDPVWETEMLMFQNEPNFVKQIRT